jgi:hypothetical protein
MKFEKIAEIKIMYKTAEDTSERDAEISEVKTDMEACKA